MDPIQKLAMTLPRWAFVGGILVIGILFLLLINPPHSVCDSQYEIFKTSQTPFLYLDSKKSYIKTTGYQNAYDNCKNGNSLGACVELFSKVQKLNQDLNASNPKCISDLSKKTEVAKALRETQELMVRLAWGNHPPDSVYDKMAWLDNNHMFLFCSLSSTRSREGAKASWEAWREKVMADLPNPNNLSRAEVWRRSIFSVSCNTL